MQKQIKVLLALLMALSLAISCAKNNPNDPTKEEENPTIKEEMLYKRWEYKDTTTPGLGCKITSKQYDNYDYRNVNNIDYSISIEEIVWNSDNKSGIIYGKYSKNDYDQSLVGKYYAIAFKDLTSTTVSICQAYKQDGVSTTATLEEAKKEFTVANGYFTFGNGTSFTVYKYTVQYGSKSAKVDIYNQTELKNLWLGLVANQFVYSEYGFKSGQFDAEGNYHDIGGETGNDYENPKPEVRTKYIKNTTYEYNGKVYLAGIYLENKDIGMPNAYRLIIIDETGTEHAWYGGGSDETVIPDENTQWTKYDFVFGYLQNY